MKFERFSELWDALITNNPNVPPMTTDTSPETMTALIEYGQGNKSKIESIRKMLGR
jgi:hypothetical protein